MSRKIDRSIPGVDSVFAWDEAIRIAKEHLRAEQEASQPERIYRLKDLIEITGLKKSTIYELIQNGRFPEPVKLTERASGWRSSDIAAWIKGRA